MLSEIRAARPDAIIEGVTVQPMIHHKDAYELILGISTDPKSSGRSSCSEQAARAWRRLATAPCRSRLSIIKLATDLIQFDPDLQVAERVPGPTRRRPDGLALCLVRLSSLAVQHRAIRELDINPLLIDE